ncbi:MAG TPA: hypothetical protein VLI90_09840, partial [Tepidisphaeraceae bacterium]|nr:hypothetical protein [Tepidisphaeraceae bacterium]
MADDPLTIRGINWRETFPFTNLFRAFRVAIHPSKIVLALVALLLLYVGGRILDGVWPLHDRAVPGEVAAYEAYLRGPRAGEKFDDFYRQPTRREIEDGYATQLMDLKLVTDRAAAEKAAQNGDKLGDVKGELLKQRAAAVDASNKSYTDSMTAAGKLSGDARKEAEQAAKETRDASVRSAYENAYAQYESAKRIKNHGLFDHFFQYQSSQVSNVVRGVREWNWFGEEHFSERAAAANAAAANNPLAALAAGEVLSSGAGAYGSPGVIQAVVRFFTIGPLWLLTQHTFYFLIFGIYFLVLWAIFGGAISRIAAVHVARDEKMSIRSALKFSISKFLSFLFAPIIPLLIVLVVGLIVAIGALVGNIPFLGPIIVGALFFLALAAGFVMALVLLGLVGGFNLMYPTIATEGSDSFDAISRSFSYLYARPWRLAFYTIIAVIYGALTYLFVRLFIYLMLVLTHKFVSVGFLYHADSTAPLWSVMWPSPTTAARLSYDIDFLTLGVGQDIGAFLVAFWVYLVISILGAFAISFYFSANTIIYYL